MQYTEDGRLIEGTELPRRDQPALAKPRRVAPPEEAHFPFIVRIYKLTIVGFALFGVYAASDRHWLFTHHEHVSGWLLILVAFWALVAAAVNARSDRPSVFGRLWARLAWPPRN